MKKFEKNLSNNLDKLKENVIIYCSYLFSPQVVFLASSSSTVVLSKKYNKECEVNMEKCLLKIS